MKYNVFIRKELLEANELLAKNLTTDEFNIINYESFDELVTMVNRKDYNIIFLSGFKSAKHCYEISKILKGKFFTSGVMVVASGLVAHYAKLKKLDLSAIISPKAEESVIVEALEKVKEEVNNLKEHDRLINSYIAGTQVKENIISVIGMRGGIGKTTIATNLAAAFANYGYKVCLVDMALQFGDVYLYNNVKPTFTLSDLIEEHLDNDTNIENYMIQKNENLFILPAPTNPEQASLVNKESTKELFVKLSNHFDAVICDTPSIFNDISLATIKLSKDILMVGTIDLATVKNCRLLVDLLTKLRLDSKIKLVVNKSGEENHGLSYNKFRSLIKLPVFAAIPCDYYRVEEFVSKGEPFVTKYPYEDITRSIETMVAKLNITQ